MFQAFLMIEDKWFVIFGAKLFYKISDTQFKKVVLGLLFTSGIFMCLSLLI